MYTNRENKLFLVLHLLTVKVWRGRMMHKHAKILFEATPISIYHYHTTYYASCVLL